MILRISLYVPGWPYVLPNWPKGFPTIADVDDDGKQDVCVATDAGTVYAIASTGQLLAGYPKQMTGGSCSGLSGPGAFSGSNSGRVMETMISWAHRRRGFTAEARRRGYL